MSHFEKTKQYKVYLFPEKIIRDHGIISIHEEW